MMSVRLRLLQSVCFAFALAACGNDLTVTVPEAALVDGVAVRDGLVIEMIVDGLRGPTQFVVDDGTFIVAEINGGENDATGRVVRVDPARAEVQVLLDGLDKPTGIAIVGDELWVMERNRLTRGPIGGDRRLVADALPNNGRSQGTLTVLPDGRILFDTSGSKRGSRVVDGSGRLFTVDSSDPTAKSVEYASGFKHAYAHTVDSAGVLWSTEMTDGNFDGRPAGDELVAVVAGADHGWPHCVGDNRPVAEFGGDADRCANVPVSQAVFAPSATPTSVDVSPFADGVLWVALWNERRVVAVGTDRSLRPAPVVEVLTGLDRPQHLLAYDDVMYVSDFGAGQIHRVTSG